MFRLVDGKWEGEESRDNKKARLRQLETELEVQHMETSEFTGNGQRHPDEKIRPEYIEWREEDDVLDYEKSRVGDQILKAIQEGKLPKEGTGNELEEQHYYLISIVLNKYFRNFKILSTLKDGRCIIESYGVQLVCEIDDNNLVSIDGNDDLSEDFIVEHIILEKMLNNSGRKVTHDENGFSFYVDGTSKISWLGVPDKEGNLLVHVNNIVGMQEWSHPYVSLYLGKKTLSSRKLNIEKVFECYRDRLLK